MKHSHIKFLIAYTVSPEVINMEEILENLRQYGSAEIIDVEIVKFETEREGYNVALGCFCDPSNGDDCEQHGKY